MGDLPRNLAACVLVALLAGGCFARHAPAPQTQASVTTWRADKVEVHKARRLLVLYSRGRPIARYQIALGPAPSGHKLRAGDGRTPEGRYVVDWRNRRSAYHRSLHISYPNAADRARAAAGGVNPGGMIMIHGVPNGLARFATRGLGGDWTDGCIAVTNAEIDAIWSRVADGTPIEILP
jgi:murein L,D-transpeptidase YafK